MSTAKQRWRALRPLLGLLLALGLLAVLAPGLEREAQAPTTSPTQPPPPTTEHHQGQASRTTTAGPKRPAQQDPATYTYKILRLYPHDRQAFTQGLLYDADGILYEGTGLWGRSSLRRVALASGEVLQIHPLEVDYFGEGLALYGAELIQLTWQSQIAFVYDQETFSQTGTFTYTTQGWGLCHDGERLIMSDGSATLYFRDPQTFAEIGRVAVHDENGPVTRLNELEYIGGEVYANVWQTDRIARIDPESGWVTGWIDLRGLLGPADKSQPVDVLNGIAYDAEQQRLFVTGKLWPRLFEIELVPLPEANRDWQQVNPDGFGSAQNNAIASLESYEDRLYAATQNSRGAQIWRSDDGLAWSVVISAGLGYSDTHTIHDLLGWQGHLYAAAGSAAGAELWRSPQGLSWTRVLSAGLGSPHNEALTHLAAFSQSLYAATRNPISGCRLWHSDDGLDWQPASQPGLGHIGNTAVSALAVYSQGLYAGTWNEAGGELWRLDDGGWTSLISAGFGYSQNVALISLVPFGGRLYALSHNEAGGLQLWRSPDGLSWSQVISDGLKHRDNNTGGGLYAYHDQLFLFSDNAASGAQAWRSSDGSDWQQVAFVGWGDYANQGTAGDRALALFRGQLYAGTVRRAGAASGAEVWRYRRTRLAMPLLP